MQTKITTIDGKVHIVDGHPQDFMTMVDGIGVSQATNLTSVTGEKVDLSDVFMMEQVKN